MQAIYMDQNIRQYHKGAFEIRGAKICGSWDDLKHTHSMVSFDMF